MTSVQSDDRFCSYTHQTTGEWCTATLSQPDDHSPCYDTRQSTVHFNNYGCTHIKQQVSDILLHYHSLMITVPVMIPGTICSTLQQLWLYTHLTTGEWYTATLSQPDDHSPCYDTRHNLQYTSNNRWVIYCYTITAWWSQSLLRYQAQSAVHSNIYGCTNIKPHLSDVLLHYQSLMITVPFMIPCNLQHISIMMPDVTASSWDLR